MRADQLLPGDMIQTMTGRVIAQRIEPSHDGLEVLVLPVSQKAKKPEIRWWWPQSEVKVISRGHSIEWSRVSRSEKGRQANSRAREAKKRARAG